MSDLNGHRYVDDSKVLELIAPFTSSNRECQVDTAKNIVRVGLAIEQSLALIVTL